jgi:hypothetical protein
VIHNMEEHLCCMSCEITINSVPFDVHFVFLVVCVTIQCVLPFSVCYHSVCVTIQCVLPFSVLPFSVCYHSVCYHSVQNLLSSCLPSKNIKTEIYGTLILPVVLDGCET